jgi:hypothetical protein
MDEIITRWAADLSKYQKEFQSQAETVAQWDRALVENSDKVRQLYSKTFQAERDAAEVERQLTMMEENQQELDSYLDRYEKEIENLMKMHGVSGRSDGLRGPDQERERTYKLAEKLQDRLNELNKDLTEMIEEINTTSQTLSKTGKPDDPVRIICSPVLHAFMLTFNSLQRSSACSTHSSRSSSLSTLALRSCRKRSTRRRRRAALLAPTDGMDWVLIPRMTSTGASVATGLRGMVVTHRSAGVWYDVEWMGLKAWTGVLGRHIGQWVETGGFHVTKAWKCTRGKFRLHWIIEYRNGLLLFPQGRRGHARWSHALSLFGRCHSPHLTANRLSYTNFHSQHTPRTDTRASKMATTGTMTPFRFMDLPPELRHQIYEQLAVVGRIFYTPDPYDQNEGIRFTDHEIMPNPSLSIPRISKAVHDKSEQIYLE